ncbi:FxsA family protein [Salinibacter altiplanensis]|uniref:FxsA family protein n=1 Tax=Salinibacter altiplanensis TaxID=1803181 RepID=UPI000C9EEDE0|nr:FxsA family protein [Salinibacter altiplanensis]
MLGRLILLFLLTPAAELALLIQVDQLIGFWATIALIVVTGVVGSHLARREGLSTWRRLNRRLQAGDLPGNELADGVIILMAGALLITPGILTDVVGFSGLIPFTRARLRSALMRWFQRKVDQGSMQMQFGVFGGTSSSNSGGPNVPPRSPGGPHRSAPDDAWEGRPQNRPTHTDEPRGDGDGTAPSSS